jgi:hypothetical protein
MNILMSHIQNLLISHPTAKIATWDDLISARENLSRTNR